MPKLQIRFVSGKGWDSRLIEWYSRCQWSHVEFIEGRWTFGEQLHGGLRNRLVSDGCYTKAAAFETWEIPVTDDQFALYRRLQVESEYTPYDWPAILSFALGPHRWHLAGRYICSGFIAGVLGSLNLLRVDFPIENYTPRDIYMLVANLPNARRIAL